MLQDIAQQIKNTAKDQITSIHTALPAKVVAVNTASCSVNVQPYGQYAMSDGASIAYPIIPDVPVAVMYCSGSGCAVAMPVKAGDDVLLIVSEAAIDEWRTGAKAAGTMRFDITNAIAIPGPVKNGALVQKAMSSGQMILGTPSCNIQIGAGGITINGSVKVNGEVTANGKALSTHIHSTPAGDSSAPK